jgi:hypothetical protein
MNYSDLTTAIQSYSEVDSNGLTSTTLATIVQNAENRIYREVNIDAYKLYASAVTVVGNTTISVPSGLRNIRYAQLIDSSGNISNLIQKDSSWMSEYNSQPAYSTGYAEPKYWANWNSNTWFVAPTPDNNYTINIAYYQQPASITSSTTSTSYVSVYAQDLLLYASLVETYKYLKGPADMIQVFEQSYQQAKESFGIEQTGRRRRDEYLDGEPRTVVNAPSAETPGGK